MQLGLIEAGARSGAQVEEPTAPQLHHAPRPTCTAARRTRSQYLQNIQTHDITFGIGPAGTGKTYLAVACAVDALERDA